MINEPKIKKAIVFVDGQNLFHTVKKAFGYTYPNYDVKLLAEKICLSQGWKVKEIYFYTGIPSEDNDRERAAFWNNKLAYMGRRKINIFTRVLKYTPKLGELPDGTLEAIQVGREKGIDIRIALDVIKLARKKTYDVALIFSQDQDLSEVAEEIREIAIEQKRWIKIASAFPVDASYKNKRGIDKTDWIGFDKKLYDSCIDPNDYRARLPLFDKSALSDT